MKRFAWMLCVTLSACASPAWYTQAAGGHLDMMQGRQEIAAYLASAPAGDPLAARLRVAREVLAFAGTGLDLPAGDAYRSFVLTGRSAVTWNVVAAPELSLEPKRWCHLVAGCLPYLGWFDQDAARRHAEALRERGLDTAVAPAGAYSTLGWFDDPVLDTMLSRSDAELAAALIHELAHRRLFVRGDAGFSESYATFMERSGTHAFLLESGRADAAEDWRERQSAQDQFTALLTASRARLQKIYAGEAAAEEKRAAKQQVFADLRARHEQLVREAWDGRAWFSSWFEPPPNNADLALAGSYLGGQCAFQVLFEQLQGDYSRFHQQLQLLAGSSREHRADWLARPC